MPQRRSRFLTVLGTAGLFVLSFLLLAGFWGSGIGKSWRKAVTAVWTTKPVQAVVGQQAKTPPKWLADYPGWMWQTYARLVPPPQRGPEAGDRMPGFYTWEKRYHTWKWQGYLVVSYVGGMAIPLLLCLLLGPRRLSDLGWRRPSPAGWELLVLAYIVALPAVLFMARTPDFIQSYSLGYKLSPWFAWSQVLSFLPEHFLIQGVLLAWFMPDRRFPRDPFIHLPTFPPWRFVKGPDGQQVRQWVPMQFVYSLAVPTRCIVPILLSGFLFFVVHIGKASEVEMWLSLPGGWALAWLACRTNGFVIPLLLHTLTAFTAFAVAVFLP